MLINPNKHAFLPVATEPMDDDDDLIIIEKDKKYKHINWYGHKFEFSTWTEYVYVSDGINNYDSYKRACLNRCFDLDPYFYIECIEEDGDEIGYILVHRSGDSIFANIGEASPFSNGIPLEWSFEQHRDFTYPLEFIKLFTTIILCLRNVKSNLPRLLIITKIFKLVWEHQRRSDLDEIFRQEVEIFGLVEKK